MITFQTTVKSINFHRLTEWGKTKLLDHAVDRVQLFLYGASAFSSDALLVFQAFALCYCSLLTVSHLEQLERQMINIGKNILLQPPLEIHLEMHLEMQMTFFQGVC